MSTPTSPLHVRWLGRVPYSEALALQQAIFEHGVDQHLLLLEHQHVFTYGQQANLEQNLKCNPDEVGAELVSVHRGGDITYHGPGQLVGYPLLNLLAKHGDSGPADTSAYIHDVEQLVIDTLSELGLPNASRKIGFPGVWLDAETAQARKICAIGVRVARGASERRTMHGFALNVNTDFAWAHQPERDGLSISVRKPDWIRPHVNHTSEVLLTKKTLRDLNLVTVCEEAGCPNLSECWKDGTATFMVLGDRCTRACGFCLIDTRKPLEPDANEPTRVAEAVKRMGLEFAVLTMVARDDLADGGMQHVADTIRAIRNENPGAQVEALISDAKGTDSLDAVLNEVEATLIDLASVGVNIVTIGQYLRPSAQHLPVVRYAEPSEFEYYKQFGERLGINHVESSPLTRSSYHAKDAHRNSSPLLHA